MTLPNIHKKPPPERPHWGMPLWQWLKHHRLIRGWTRTDLHKRCAVSKRNIWLLENAIAIKPRNTLLLRDICKAFEMSQEDTEHTHDLLYIEQGLIPDDLQPDPEIAKVFADFRRKRRKKYPELYERPPKWDQLAKEAQRRNEPESMEVKD